MEKMSNLIVNKLLSLQRMISRQMERDKVFKNIPLSVGYFCNHQSTSHDTLGSHAPGKEEVRPFEDIPGPLSLPIVGTLYLYLPFIGKYSFRRLHHTGLKKFREFGPIVRERIMGDMTLLLLFDPHDIETMYSVEGRYPMRRSHTAVEKYRLDRPHMYSSGGLLPT
ncbi:hypothetical protein SK128_011715, partial [Halocaridina rubra]